MVSAKADILTLVSSNGVNDGQFAVGPLTGIVQIGNGAPESLTIFCVDFGHEVNFGQTWDVSISLAHQLHGIYGPPNTPGNISAESFYRQEVVLTYTMFLGVSDNQTLINLQHAVWNLSAPGTYTDAGAIGWNQYAASHMHDPTFNTAFHDAILLSPLTYVSDPGGEVHIGPGQEMITFSHIPEPTVLAYAGIGLLALFGIRRLF